MRQRKRQAFGPASTLQAAVLSVCLTLPAAAQNQGLVVRDGSIGDAPAGIVAHGVDDLGQPADYLIRADLGEQRGGNLFHSFGQFSIGTGETATFTSQGAPNPGAIDNVISRVTGGDASEIDGTLRSTIAGADVWLMNPAGLVFGQNARLDVPAGFHASTADSLELTNGEAFEARPDAPLPVLAVDPPEAFGFLGDANVRVDGGLDVPFGEALSLAAGGAVVIQPGASVEAEGGVVHLEGGRLALEGAVSARNGGDIALHGGTVTVSGASASSNSGGPAGSILIDAEDALTVLGYVVADGGGNITLQGRTIAVEGSVSALDADLVSGPGGTILLDAEQALTVLGYVSANGDTAGGDVTLRGGTITVGQFGNVSADSFDGEPGSVVLDAEQALTVLGYVTSEGENGGDVTLHGRTVSIEGGGIDAGSVVLDAEQALTVLGYVSASGANGGDVTLHGRTVSIEPGGSVSANGFSAGGSVQLTAEEEADVAGFVSARAFDVGANGGTIEITAPRIGLNPSAALLVDGGFGGQPGTVTLNGEVTVSNAGLVVRDSSLGAGRDTVVSGGTDAEGLVQYLITPDLGQTLGHNLLHSFLRFSLAPGEIASFTGPDPFGGPQSIQNVLARVTGGGVSRIRGTIRTTIPGAALWLLNPAGWIFGSGAQLDVLGAFHASTADAVGFDSGEFFFVDPERELPGAPTALPTHVVVGPDNTGSINVFGNLAMSNGSALSLHGTTVNVVGNLSADSFDGDAGSVVLDAEQALTVLGYVSAGGGSGDVTLRGGTITVGPSGNVSADSFDGDPGSVVLDAEQALTVLGHVTAEGENGGDVTLNGGTVTVEPSGRVSADGFSSGSGGSVVLEATVALTILGYVTPLGHPAESSVSANGEGGEITLRGGTVTLDAATVGAPFVFGVVPGTIRIESSGEVEITNDSLVSAWSFAEVGGQGGEIHVLTDGDVLIESSALIVGSSSGTAGFVSINCSTESCTNRLEMRDQARIDAGGFLGSFAQGGNVEVHAGTIALDRSTIANIGFFGGAGSVTIHGDVEVRISNTDGSPADFSQLLTSGGFIPGIMAPSLGSHGGGIAIDAPLIVVEEGAALWVQSGLSGGGGTILLDGDEVEILSGAVLDGTSLFGNGGSIEILGRTSVAISGVGVDGPSRIRALAAGGGIGGSILVSSPEILLDGGAIATSSTDQAGTGEIGSSGDVTLTGHEITMKGGARIDTSTFSLGDGGAINLLAPTGFITIEGEGTGTSARTGAQGRGGQVTIEARDLTVRDGATIAVESRASFAELEPVFDDALRLVEAVLEFIGTEPQDPPVVAEGDAGAVEVWADRVTLASHGSIVASTSGPGAGGDVDIETALLDLGGFSAISAESTGSGDAGSVRVTADELHATEGSEISVRAESANGGDVTLTVADRVHLVDSTISADVGDGEGGNITIDPTFVILDHSDIVARAGAGTGGEITIIADALIKDPDSVISASAGNPSLSGTVNITAPDVDLAGSLAALSDSALDASDQLAERCSARGRGAENGSFTVAGAGLRPGPEGWLSAWSLAAADPVSLAASRCH